MSSSTLNSWMRAPVGHRELIEGMWRSAREGRLSHAFGFFGPRGVGKYLAARWFAAGLLCKDPNSERPGPPCGECGACKRVDAESHSDVYVLDPSVLNLETIRVQDVVQRDDSERKTVDEFLILKAAEGGARVVLIRDFDRANAFAQNALLKTLEEPGAGVALILESSAPARLVGTVKSRIVNVVFDRLTEDATTTALTELGFDARSRERFGRWCRGAPGRAIEMSALGVEAMVGLIERALAGEDAFVLLPELAGIKAEFPGKTPSVQNRARGRFFLDLILEVVRDLNRVAGGQAPTHVAFGELARPEVLANPARLRRAVDLCLASRQDVDMNLAPDAACERALLALATISKRVNRKERV